MLNILLSLISFCNAQFPVQASGYGSGEDTFEDMEGVDEVKKVVEERVLTMVCTHTPCFPLSCPELGPKKTAFVLPGPIEPGTRRYVLICCQPAEGGK